MADNDEEAGPVEELRTGLVSMKARLRNPETSRDKRNVAPPTAKYYYGTGGRRWAGRGRKAPLRNWKRRHRTRHQWVPSGGGHGEG